MSSHGSGQETASYEMTDENCPEGSLVVHTQSASPPGGLPLCQESLIADAPQSSTGRLKAEKGEAVVETPPEDLTASTSGLVKAGPEAPRVARESFASIASSQFDRHDMICSTQLEMSFTTDRHKIPFSEIQHNSDAVISTTDAITDFSVTPPERPPFTENQTCPNVSSGSSSSSIPDPLRMMEPVYNLLHSWMALPQFDIFLSGLPDASTARSVVNKFLCDFQGRLPKHDSVLSGYLADRSKSDSSGCRNDSDRSRVSLLGKLGYRSKARKSDDSHPSRVSLDSEKSVGLMGLRDESFFSQEGDSLEEDNAVYAPWKDNYFYPCVVKPLPPAKSSSKKCKEDDRSRVRVQFEDGDSCTVKFTRVYNHLHLPAGALVHVDRCGNHEYELARITRVRPPKTTLLYEVEFVNDRHVCFVARGQVIIEKSNLSPYCIPVEPICEAMSAASLGKSPKSATKRAQTDPTQAPGSAKKAKKMLFTKMHFFISGVSGCKSPSDDSSEMEISTSLSRKPADVVSDSPLRGSQPVSSQSDDDSADKTPDKQSLEAMIAAQGGTIIPSSDQLPTSHRGVYLIAPRPLTTMKFLWALSCNIPCVNVQWVSDCLSRESLLPLSAYRLPAGYDSHGNLLEWKRRPALFQGMKILVPSHFKHWSRLIKNMQGEVICRAGAKIVDDSLKFAFATAKKDFTDSVWSKLLEFSIPVVTTDFIVQSLICGGLVDYESFLYLK